MMSRTEAQKANDNGPKCIFDEADASGINVRESEFELCFYFSRSARADFWIERRLFLAKLSRFFIGLSPPS